VRSAQAAVLACALGCAGAQASETHELIGQLGARTVAMNLYASPLPDGSMRVSGDYLLLPTLQQRFVEGERSRQLGITVLREGTTPILYGRLPLATLQGTWTGGVFRGTRHGPGGQPRERFVLSDRFPSMAGYDARVHCEVAEGRYRATLAYAVEAGRLQSFEWRSRVAPGEHPCVLTGLEQRAQEGGLRFASGECSVLLRDLGEFVRVRAEGCGAHCGSQGYLEPMLVDRRGQCLLVRAQR